MFSFRFFFKKRFLREGLKEPVFRGGDFFRAGCNFSTKNEQKSGIFNDKKNLKTGILCSVVTENPNWEI